MGINSRISKTETLNGAVDILLFKKYCVEHSSFEKLGHIADLWKSCAVAYFGPSDDRDEKLADMISQFELKFSKSGGQDFNFVFRKVFPRRGLNKMRLSQQDYFEVKSLVGYITNRNLEGKGYHFFSDYKKISEDTIEELKEVFISKMEKYQSKVKGELINTLLDEKDLYTGCESQEGTEDISEEDNFDTNTESIEIIEFELEKKYLTEKSSQENIENRRLTRHEDKYIIKKIMAEFEEEYKGFDESEIIAVKSLFYKKINKNN